MLKLLKFVSVSIILFFFLFSPYYIFAEDTTNYTDNTNGLSKQKQKEYESKTKKIEKLNEKARIYQKILDIKRNQKTTLYQQLQNINNEIKSLQEEITTQKEKIITLNDKIAVLEKRITENQKKIKEQKKLLSYMVRSYYEYAQHDWYPAILSNEGVAGFLTNKDRLTQSGDKIKKLLGALKSLKNNLENKKRSLTNKKKEVIEMQRKLEEKNLYLISNKQRKNNLLIQTKGEEARYQKKLERIKAEKMQLLGDIDELFNANSANINVWKANLPQPKSGLASLRWYYSQKDSRWGNKTIGNSNSLMKNYGCAITSISMVFTYHGNRISPGLMCKQSIFDWDLIKWPNTWGGLSLDKGVGHFHGNINWKTIDKNLKKKNPVVVYIRAGRKGGHYVVIHHKDKKGRYIVHDPYFGPNIFLSSTMSLLSKLYKVPISKRSIDQMILYK